MFIQEFIDNHRADDIVYALHNPGYFKLSGVERQELYTFVFRAIDEAKRRDKENQHV